MSDVDLTTGTELDELLSHIQSSRNFDFSGYKRPSLIRRFQKRMREVHCDSFADYRDYLETHAEEYELLFDTILINVTRFFRDPVAWQYLADEIVPRLVTGKETGQAIRVWSAGCSSGEEAYSLAMVLSEALGPEQFRARVKIYGTDADEQVLSKARQATYSEKELADVPSEYRSRYFEATTAGHTFRNDLRRQIIFGRHNLVQDAPISRIDLLVCRNTLMYFNAEAQDAVVERFHFALNDRGYLFLGKAETLLSRSSMFRAVDLRLRVFTRSTDGHRLRPLPSVAVDVGHQQSNGDIRDLALELMAVPAIVLDARGAVVVINAAARQQFGLGSREVGAAIQDLEVSYRPAELRTAIDEATAGRRQIERSGVRWTGPDDDAQILNILVTPLLEDDGTIAGTSITFTDVRSFQVLQDELERANRDLETAYEELQSTNEELQTTNEELQSTNDELQAANEELHVRGSEVDRAKLYLEGIVTGLHRGVVVLGLDMTVRLWNRWAEDLWGMRSEEVRGRALESLDFGLPVEKLRGAITACLEGSSETVERTVVARNRKGQTISCRVVCTRLVLGESVDGVILWMEGLPDA